MISIDGKMFYKVKTSDKYEVLATVGVTIPNRFQSYNQ